MKRKILNIIVILAMLLSVAPAAFAQGSTPPDRMSGEVPARVTENKLETPVVDAEVTSARLDGSLLDATGPTQVIIRLRSESVAERNIQGRSAQRIQRLLQTQQANFLSRVEAMGANARVIAQVQLVMNAVFVEVDASALTTIARDPMVARIAPVGTYELDLSETVPYIGGSNMHAMGFDGTGVRVAVLDSGIDYTHIAFGGSGDPADYAANDPTIIEPGTFPTAKVVGGYDFVGNGWPTTPLAPDPDPLDDGPAGGHGTHVGDIIGWRVGRGSRSLPVRGQSLLLGINCLLGRRPDPGYGIRPRPERRWRPGGPCRRDQYVPGLQLRAAFR